MPNEVDFSIVRNFYGSGYPQVKVMARLSDDQPTYIAIGTRGSATDTPNWRIIKFTYVTGNNGGNVFSMSQTSEENQIADNYASLEYK